MIHFPRTKRLLAVSLRPVALTIVVMGALATVSAQSLPGYKAPDTPKAPKLPAAMKAASGQAPLAKLYGHLKPDASRIKRLPPLDARTKQKSERKSEKRLNIGVVRTLPSDLNPLTDGTLYSVAEGDVRVAAVNSQGALYTRLHFKGFSLPVGARVFVYSAANPDIYLGPYEGRGPWGDGMFWTAPVRGDQVVIEYRRRPELDRPMRLSKSTRLATSTKISCRQTIRRELAISRSPPNGLTWQSPWVCSILYQVHSRLSAPEHF